MKKIFLAITISLPLIAIAQQNTPESQRYKIEGLYLGMPKAAAENEISKFCLKNNGDYKTKEIKGEYSVIFANSIGCNTGYNEYLYIKTALDKVYDIAKTQFIDVERNYENSTLLLERAKTIYGVPALVLDSKENKKRITWEINYENISRLPKKFREDGIGYTSTKYNHIDTVACWGQCTSATVNNDIYVRSGNKALAFTIKNGKRMYLGQRLTDFAAIDTAWATYQKAEDAQIEAERATNKSIIDSVSF